MPLRIDAAFPGGNIIAESVGDNEVLLHQDLRDTDQPWFYWCFNVTGAEGKTVRFNFTRSRALGVRGPAFSRDKGKTWQWAGAGCVEENSFIFRFPEDAYDVRFSFAMPYQLADWERFAGGLPASDLFSLHTLCTTNKGRTAPYALLGPSNPEDRILITARHHCCEMMVSYTIEGLISWLLESDDPAAARLREKTQFLFVPFADLDGTEDGDQGKGRKPRDHGRDYLDNSLYAETAAIRELVPSWSDEKFALGMDLHCPWIAGKHNEVIYLVGSQDERNAAEQRRFSKILESAARGPLPFSKDDYLPFGVDWNTGANYDKGKSGARWFAEQPGIRLAASIELPYANTRGAEVNQDTARQFGEDLGRAIDSYLYV